MKTFIVINGKKATLIKKENLQEAITYCQNFCNHSEEVIVREIKVIDGIIQYLAPCYLTCWDSLRGIVPYKNMDKTPLTNKHYEKVSACNECGYFEFFIFSSGAGGHLSINIECVKCHVNKELVYIPPCNCF